MCNLEVRIPEGGNSITYPEQWHQVYKFQILKSINSYPSLKK